MAPAQAGRSRPPVMADVARLAGVSHQTVSRVLNDHPNVREQTRRRVQAAIAELGYRPNQAARVLVTGTSQVIGVVAQSSTLYGPISVLNALAQAALQHGFTVSVVPTHDLPLLDEKYGIPGELSPCHISLIGGYVVGGHVPIDVVDRLLSEKPQITGITLPGMPTGTPGMPGEKSGPLQIYEIAKGPRKVYAVV